jgi:hypothetical protein
MPILPANFLNSIERYSRDHDMDFGKIAERLSIEERQTIQEWINSPQPSSDLRDKMNALSNKIDRDQLPDKAANLSISKFFTKKFGKPFATSDELSDTFKSDLASQRESQMAGQIYGNFLPAVERISNSGIESQELNELKSSAREICRLYTDFKGHEKFIKDNNIQDSTGIADKRIVAYGKILLCKERIVVRLHELKRSDSKILDRRNASGGSFDLQASQNEAREKIARADDILADIENTFERD